MTGHDLVSFTREFPTKDGSKEVTMFRCTKCDYVTTSKEKAAGEVIPDCG